MQVHLSKFAEDLIIWNTQEFAFVKMADAYATGSSLMPQKKNPDALELLRGKASRQIGHTMTLLTMLKGTPTAYNKDNQEDKEAIFGALNTAEDALNIATGVLATLDPKPERMKVTPTLPLTLNPTPTPTPSPSPTPYQAGPSERTRPRS